jgi:hypothetical protein
VPYSLAATRQEEIDLFRARQAKERQDYTWQLEEQCGRELADLRARHLRDQAECEKIRERARALRPGVSERAQARAEERENDFVIDKGPKLTK